MQKIDAQAYFVTNSLINYLKVLVMQEPDSKENYLYGMIFSLVRDNLKLIEKSKHKKPSLWAKARGSAREVKIENTLREIIKRKLDKYPNENEWGRLLMDDLSFISDNDEVWNDIDGEQIDYIIQMASKFI